MISRRFSVSKRKGGNFSNLRSASPYQHKENFKTRIAPFTKTVLLRQNSICLQYAAYNNLN